MKKRVALFSMLISSVLLFAKPKASEPEWFQNYRNVYPNKEYIAQRGSGTTAEDAKTDALAALARYFQSNVSANLSTSLMSITANDSVDEQTVVVDEVSVQSQVDFFGVEYTESYFYKPEKKWYCVIYINREDAWTQFKPQIDGAKNIFYGFYNKAQKEDEPLLRCGFYNSAWNAGKDFLEKLEYGRIINFTEEEKYEKDRNVLSEIPSLIRQEINNSSIYISITGDYAGIIETAVSSSLSKLGFTVGKGGSYTAKVSVNSNPVGTDPVAVYPAIDLEITNKNGKSVYSFKYKSEEKIISYTLEGAQKKAFPSVAEQLEKLLSKDIGSTLNIK